MPITAAAISSSQSPRPYSGWTIGLQVFTGTLGAGVGGFAGALVGGALMSSGGSQDWSGLAGLVLGFFVGAHLGVPIGIWAGGALRGHRGSFLWTFLTGLAGTALNLTVVLLGVPVWSLLISAAAVVGMIWVYHHTDGVTRGHRSAAIDQALATTRPFRPWSAGPGDDWIGNSTVPLVGVRF